MNVLYEESGAFRVGTVLSETEASLQVEAPHGKRSKIKSAQVLLRFDESGLADFIARAEGWGADIQPDFLWEVCGQEEFGFEALAREYCGHAPSPLEAAGVLLRLHAAPMYFHRKGRGRFRAAPPETLKAALAGQERKRAQAEQMEQWSQALLRGELPEGFRPLLKELLYKPDRGRLETKALEAACAATGLAPAKLLASCGAIPDTHDYHFNRFLFEQFPQGVDFPAIVIDAADETAEPAQVAAFSIDDAATTEIDDAFSLTRLPDGGMRVGIHIAAPALAFSPGSALDAIARERLSTAYMPGIKLTMLPTDLVERHTLAKGRSPMAASLYLDVDETFRIVASHSRLERVPVAANLRHHELEGLDEDFLVGQVDEARPYAAELHWLYRFALSLEQERGKAEVAERLEYSFYVDEGRVRIVQRKRGSPLDKLVAELMILTNRMWGKLLDDQGIAAIYRTQSEGKARMTTAAAEHQGLGVSHYAWCTSPLRRYVDLVNQWQLLALLRGEEPPFGRKSEPLLAAMRDFELRYAAYDNFQRQMEQYWCLRWLVQEGVRQARVEVIRDNLVRFCDVPLYTRVPSLTELPPGSTAVVEIEEVDLIDSTVRCLYKKAQQAPET